MYFVVLYWELKGGRELPCDEATIGVFVFSVFSFSGIIEYMKSTEIRSYRHTAVSFYYFYAVIHLPKDG